MPHFRLCNIAVEKAKKSESVSQAWGMDLRLRQAGFVFTSNTCISLRFIRTGAKSESLSV